MTDVYKIGVSIALANGVSSVLAIIGRDLLGLDTSIAKVEKSFGRWGLAIGGVAAILGGSAMVKGLASLAKHGGEVNHQLELMKIAGMQNSEIQASLAQAMKTTGSVMTTTLSENLAHIRELRYAFGDTSVAISHMDEISKSNAVLNAIKGGGKDQVWDLVKSLEQKGLTFDPKQFSSYVDTMTKVVEASGGKVTPQMFMSTFKYGRTAMLGWDEAFVGGALPRLIQSMASSGGGGGGGSGGPGNALMSAFAKVVQGQMPKTAAEEFDRMGLAIGGAAHIKGSADSQIPGGIAGRDQFMANPYEWVQKTLMPALAKHGITSQNDIIAQISKMFPVRTASQVITEMALQGRFHESENSQFEKDSHQQHGAMGVAGYDELIKNDYPTVLKAFNEQWTSLLQTIGSPLMQPGGRVLRAMSAMTGIMNSMAQFAGAHPEGMKIALEAIAGVTTSLFVAGLIALGAVIAPLLGLGGILVSLAAGLTALAAMNWDHITSGFNQIKDAISSFIGWLSGIPGKILGLIGSAGKALGIDPGGEGSHPGKDGKPYHKSMFNPGDRPIKAQPISLSLNVDGRTLAQVISDKIDALYRYDTSSPAFNGASRYGV